MAQEENNFSFPDLKEPVALISNAQVPAFKKRSSTSKSLGKNLKKLGAFLGLTLILVSLPGVVFLVKQQQEIRSSACYNEGDCEKWKIIACDKGIWTGRVRKKGTDSWQEEELVINDSDCHDSPAYAYNFTLTDGDWVEWQQLRNSSFYESGEYQVWGCPTPTPTPTPTETPSPTPTPTGIPSPTPTPTATPTPSPTPTPTPTGEPTPTPTLTPTPTIPPTASCQWLRVFDRDWNLISDYSTLGTGDQVYLGAFPSFTGGEIDSARFRVNGNDWQIATEQNTLDGDTFYYLSYLIPEETYHFRVEAEIHHLGLGWL